MPTESEEVLALLRNIQENQQQSLAMQRESLELQRKAVEATLNQFSRAEALQVKAEQIQARSAEIMASGRRMMKIVLPIIILLIIYLSWLLFRRWL